MARTVDPETYLRVTCERTLLSQDRRNPMVDGFEAAVISRALVAAGTINMETAQGVLDEYGVAMALRDPQRGRMLMHRRSLAGGERQQLSAQRVELCDREFAHGDKQWTLERVLFTNDATHVDLSGTDSLGRGGGGPVRRMGFPGLAPAMGPPQQPHPQTLALADDQGTTATGHASQSQWSGGGFWQASYRTDLPLSPNTEWIDVDGTRIELPERRPAPEVLVEEIEPIDPLTALLYREILSIDRSHGGYDTVEIACRALVTTGSVSDDDPMLGEVRRIADAVASLTPTANLSEPWAAVLGRFSKGDGTTGRLAIGAVIDDLDGFSIRIDGLSSEPTSFSIALAMSPGTPLLRHFPGTNFEPSPITWWAEDDRMNAYVAFSDQGGGGGNVAEGQVTSLAPLDPKATELRLLPTGSRTRAVVAVSLATLRGPT